MTEVLEHTRAYTKGQTVSAPRGVYRLEAGILGLAILSDQGDDPCVVRLFFPGDLIAWREHDACEIVALTDAALTLPASYGDLEGSLEHQLRRASDLVHLRTLRLKDGLVKLLDLLALTIGEPETDTTVLIHVSQQQLATMLGSTRESVSHLLPSVLGAQRLNPAYRAVRWRKPQADGC